MFSSALSCKSKAYSMVVSRILRYLRIQRTILTLRHFGMFCFRLSSSISRPTQMKSWSNTSRMNISFSYKSYKYMKHFCKTVKDLKILLTMVPHMNTSQNCYGSRFVLDNWLGNHLIDRSQPESSELELCSERFSPFSSKFRQQLPARQRQQK